MNSKKNSSRLFYYLLFGLAIILIFFAFADSGTSKNKITYQEATAYFQEGKIEGWYVVGKDKIVFKLTEAAGSTIDSEKFPKKYDVYMSYDAQAYDDWYENQKATYAGYQAPAGSIWDTIYPILMVILAVVFIIFIFKMFSSKGNGTMGFGKSRARTATNIKVKFADIAGAEEEKEELKEIVEFLKNPSKFTELGARIPKGVLLVGPPGTGKTLLARAVAGESGVPFLSISGSDFVEMFVGVGASRVRDMFEQAKRTSPCIIFIDEIDAVGRQRGTGLGGGNDEREQTLNQLLVELDGFEANQGIIVLAATNRSDVLDPALLRPGRFDRQVYVNRPDVKGREGIIKIHAKNKPLAKDINFTTLARITGGFTGADIENMLNEAAILAAREGRNKILMVDITEGINKVMMGPQKKSAVVTEKDRKITAYHEAGHALLKKKLEHSDDVQEVSIMQRGGAAGYTMSKPTDDTNHMTYNQLNDLIAEFMGGRIAEEIVFNDVSVGASDDIMRSSDLARNMVTKWGMSQKFGFISFGDSNSQVFMGRGYEQRNQVSEKMAGEIDEEVKAIMDFNYARAKKILQENREYLDEMASLLLSKNTIYTEEVNMILEGKKASEIVEIMEEKEQHQRKVLELEKLIADKQRQLKEVDIKLQTSEVFMKHGVMSEKELEELKSLRVRLEKEIDAEIERRKKELGQEEPQEPISETVSDSIYTLDDYNTVENFQRGIRPKDETTDKDAKEDKGESKSKTKKQTSKTDIGDKK